MKTIGSDFEIFERDNINCNLLSKKTYKFKNSEISEILKSDINIKKECPENLKEDLFDPLEDLKNEEIIEYKEKTINLSCPLCFNNLLCISELKKVYLQSTKSKEKIIIAKEFKNMIIDPRILVNKEMNFNDKEYDLKKEDINFESRCNSCNEVLGIYNYNKNKVYLFRFLD